MHQMIEWSEEHAVIIVFESQLPFGCLLFYIILLTYLQLPSSDLGFLR